METILVDLFYINNNNKSQEKNNGFIYIRTDLLQSYCFDGYWLE